MMFVDAFILNEESSLKYAQILSIVLFFIKLSLQILQQSSFYWKLLFDLFLLLHSSPYVLIFISNQVF